MQHKCRTNGFKVGGLKLHSSKRLFRTQLYFFFCMDTTFLKPEHSYKCNNINTIHLVVWFFCFNSSDCSIIVVTFVLHFNASVKENIWSSTYLWPVIDFKFITPSLIHILGFENGLAFTVMLKGHKCSLESQAE